MAKRNNIENEIVSTLCDMGGWTMPTMGTTARLLPSVTPANGNKEGKGRGTPVFDLEIDGRVLALKGDIAGEKSFTITTGKEGAIWPEDSEDPAIRAGVKKFHIDAILGAMDDGLSVPVVIVQPDGDGWYMRRVDYGRLYRRLGLERRAVGQGKRPKKGEVSHPVLWGNKIQPYVNAEGEKILYQYISLSLNIGGVPAEEIDEARVNSFAEMSEVLKGWARG